MTILLVVIAFYDSYYASLPKDNKIKEYEIQ